MRAAHSACAYVVQIAHPRLLSRRDLRLSLSSSQLFQTCDTSQYLADLFVIFFLWTPLNLFCESNSKGNHAPPPGWSMGACCRSLHAYSNACGENS